MTVGWQCEYQGNFLRSGVNAGGVSRNSLGREDTKGISGRGNSMNQALAVVSGMSPGTWRGGEESSGCMSGEVGRCLTGPL